MPIQNLILNVPEELFEQIRKRAARKHRSIEDETLDLLSQSMPLSDALPAQLTAALDELALLDDEQLWRAARSHFSIDAAGELESLNFTQQAQGLTSRDREKMDALSRQYDRAMLIRARAAALLRDRGHDVTDLLAKR